MYAVIKTGGKQQKVKAGDVIEVEKIVHEGETLTFQPILVVDDDGTAHVGAEAAKASVTAKPMGETKGDKVKIFKYRPKSGYARKAGHRQMLTLLEIQEVSLSAAARKTTRSVAKAKPAARKTPAKAAAGSKTSARSKSASGSGAATEADVEPVTDADGSATEP
jgi:large subunit ribosomal protein L21